MKVLLRGIIGRLGSVGAPRPSGAGSTRQPDVSSLRGGGLCAGESAARVLTVLLLQLAAADLTARV
jgi:hypothetical protein